MRFEDAPEWVIDLMEQVRTEHFPLLARAKIKVVYDLKKRTKQGRQLLGVMQKASEKDRYLTSNETGTEDGYDYIMYLDKRTFEAIEEGDRIRLIRHELRHCDFDMEAKGDPYKIVDHDINEFHAEVELNKDDPGWHRRISLVAESVWDREYTGPVDDGPGLFDGDQPDNVTNLADRRAAKGGER